MYTLNSQLLSPCSSVRDLGINLQTNLKPSVYCADIAAKANACSKLIVKSFLSRNAAIMTRAFAVYVRPWLENCTPIWSPHNISDINTLENVQRAFTRNIYRVCHLPRVPYDDRLQFLGLERLELRRLHADLCFMFKIVKNFVSCNIKNVLQFATAVNTRSRSQI